MFGFHKPKIYRSIGGCCICRAKSSSSRFTDSGKYEPYFTDCFNLVEEKRAGDICNACVLLVKRFRKLPSGLHRHWGHVVDARANFKPKSKTTPKKKHEDTDDDDDDVIPKRKRKRRRIQMNQNKTASSSTVPASASSILPDFLDPAIWRPEKVCCGTIFRGPFNAVLIDTRYYKPCPSRQSGSGDPGSHRHVLLGSSEEDSSSNDSASSPLSNSESAESSPLPI